MIRHLLRLTVTAAALSFTSLAAAAALGEGSEYLHQAPAHHFELIPHMDVGFARVKYVANDRKEDSTLTPLGVAAEFGLHEMFAIGLDLDYMMRSARFTCATDPCDGNYRTKGLVDPKILFKGRNALQVGTIRYGADVSFTIEKHKISASGDRNGATGGSTVTPWAGYELPLGRGALGAKLAFDLYKGDRKATKDGVGEYKFTDGRKIALSVFYEGQIQSSLYGAALTYAEREESRVSLNGGSSAGNHDKGNDIELKLYSTTVFSERIAFVPDFYIRHERYPRSAEIDSAYEFGLRAAGRFTF